MNQSTPKKHNSSNILCPVTQSFQGLSFTTPPLCRCPNQIEKSHLIYKHLVYNPYVKNIQTVIQEAQDEKNLNSGLEWQFVRTQPVTEYEWVAIFKKQK